MNLHELYFRLPTGCSPTPVTCYYQLYLPSSRTTNLLPPWPLRFSCQLFLLTQSQCDQMKSFAAQSSRCAQSMQPTLGLSLTLRLLTARISNYLQPSRFPPTNPSRARLTWRTSATSPIYRDYPQDFCLPRLALTLLAGCSTRIGVQSVTSTPQC